MSESNSVYRFDTPENRNYVILRIFVPATLVFLGLVLSLIQFFQSLGSRPFHLTLLFMPHACGLMLAHILWERPYKGTAYFFSSGMILACIGLVTIFNVIPDIYYFWYRTIDPYLSGNYRFYAFQYAGIWLDLFLLPGYAAAIWLIIEGFTRRIRFSMHAAAVMFACFLAYAIILSIYSYIRFGQFIVRFFPHLFLAAAAFLLNYDQRVADRIYLPGLFHAAIRAATGENQPDYTQVRNELLALRRMTERGALTEEAYEKRRMKVLKRI